jgi:hypothetical protein
MLPVMRKSPRLSAPHVDGWRWEYVRDLNIPARRKLANRYSTGNLPDAAADFLASATGWALHKESGVDRDANRFRSEALKVRLLAAGSVFSRFAQCHAITRMATIAADQMGHVQRSVFTKARIKRAIPTTRKGLHTTHDCSLLSLDMGNSRNTISRQRFLAELY